MIERWINTNSIEYVITSSYTDGKGYLFNLFFGWRRTHNEEALFSLSKKDWKTIDTMIKYYHIFIDKNS